MTVIDNELNEILEKAATELNDLDIDNVVFDNFQNFDDNFGSDELSTTTNDSTTNTSISSSESESESTTNNNNYYYYSENSISVVKQEQNQTATTLTTTTTDDILSINFDNLLSSNGVTKHEKEEPSTTTTTTTTTNSNDVPTFNINELPDHVIYLLHLNHGILSPPLKHKLVKRGNDTNLTSEFKQFSELQLFKQVELDSTTTEFLFGLTISCLEGGNHSTLVDMIDKQLKNDLVTKLRCFQLASGFQFGSSKLSSHCRKGLSELKNPKASLFKINAFPALTVSANGERGKVPIRNTITFVLPENIEQILQSGGAPQFNCAIKVTSVIGKQKSVTIPTTATTPITTITTTTTTTKTRTIPIANSVPKVAKGARVKKTPKYVRKNTRLEI